MIKSIVTCFMMAFPFLAQALTLAAGDISKKWAKPTIEELSMTVYAKDTSANALVLYQQNYSRYDYQESIGFFIKKDIKQKIKILKQEGTDEGTIMIPYQFETNGIRENISGIEAWSFNLVDGKIVKSKLEKKYVYDKELNNNFRHIKISLPEVKIGTVIEFKYTKTTNNVYYLPDWDIQRDIPVLNTDFQISIPEYFDFNIAVKGFEMLDIKEKSENMQFHLGNGANGPNMIPCSVREINCIAQDIPALRDEVYVWCLDDFLSGVRFEIRGTRFPNSIYKAYTNSWEDIEKTLNDETDFQQYLRIANPWKDEIKALTANLTDEKDKIAAIYEFVKNAIRWNDAYSLIGENPKEALKNGTGNNAQINFLLMSALRDAKIETYPILLSRRSNGRLPITHPSLSKLNTFIVAAETSDSSIYYMDGSSKFGGLNVLPASLLVDRGRVFNKNHTEKWVDLTGLTKSIQSSNIMANLEPSGLLNGIRITNYTNQMAYEYKSRFKGAKDSMEFVKNIQNEYDLIVDSIEINGKEPMSSRVTERIVFNKQIDPAGDYIYIYPLIFREMTENSFTQTERKLPIEFTYPAVYQTICTILIPESYQVEEIPKPVKFVLNDKKGLCQFLALQSGNLVQFKFSFQMNQIIFPQSDYQYIRDFYGQAVAKNSEMLVLKKKPL